MGFEQMKRVSWLVIAMAMTGTSAQAQSTVEQAVYAQNAARLVARDIARICPDKQFRLREADLRLGYAQGVAAVMALGYPRAEVEAAYQTLADPQNSGRIQAHVQAYMSARGGDKNVRVSICSIGASEIQQGTTVGHLLKKG